MGSLPTIKYCIFISYFCPSFTSDFDRFFDQAKSPDGSHRARRGGGGGEQGVCGGVKNSLE